MRFTRLNGLVGAAVGLGLIAPSAALAQYPHQPKCDGKQTLPILDRRYIKKYCGPTVNPGTCFGYYPTRWSRWEDVCPPGTDCGGPHPVQAAPAATGDPRMIPTTPAVTPLPLETAPQPAPSPTGPPKPTAADPAKPMPLPLPGTPAKPDKPEKPRNEANATPPLSIPELMLPEIPIPSPVLATPAEPIVLPPIVGGKTP